MKSIIVTVTIAVFTVGAAVTLPSPALAANPCNPQVQRCG